MQPASGRAVRFACGVVLLAAGCRDAAGVATVAEAPVARAPTADRRVVATGRVEGWQEADVATKLPGRVLAFALEEGAEVRAGEPVVRLEHLDLEARVRRAEARAREADLAHERARALRAEGIVAASELDRAQALAGERRAALAEARALLGYATIRAPFSGTLVRKFKEVGEGVTLGPPPDPVFRLADLSRLKVVAEVPENDVAGVGVGQAAEVVADAYPERAFAATVVRVGAAVGRKRLRSDDPRSRIDEKVVEVELALAADARLKSGMTVTAVLADGAEADPGTAAAASTRNGNVPGL